MKWVVVFLYRKQIFLESNNIKSTEVIMEYHAVGLGFYSNIIIVGAEKSGNLRLCSKEKK